MKTIPIHDHLRGKLCDLYENDCIFDKFECVWSGDDQFVTSLYYLSSVIRISLHHRNVLTGSYHNYFRIYDTDTLNDVVLQADKSAFKIKKIGGAAPGQKLGAKNGARPNGLKDMMALDALDFNKKILHASWHPKEATIAVNLSLLFFVDPSLTVVRRLQRRTICSCIAPHERKAGRPPPLWPKTRRRDRRTKTACNSRNAYSIARGHNDNTQLLYRASGICKFSSVPVPSTLLLIILSFFLIFYWHFTSLAPVLLRSLIVHYFCSSPFSVPALLSFLSCPVCLLHNIFPSAASPLVYELSTCASISSCPSFTYLSIT